MAAYTQLRTARSQIHAVKRFRTPALLRAVITAVVFAEGAFAGRTSAQIRRPPTPPVADSARAADSAMRDLMGLAAGALRCADAGGCPAAGGAAPLVFPPAAGRPAVRAVAAPEFIDLAAAGDRTCALAKSGELFCWRARDPAPARVETTIRFAGIAVGRHQVCAAGLAKVALPRLEMYCAKEDGRLVTIAGAPIAEQFALGDRILCIRTPDGPIWCRTGEGRLAPVPGVPPLVAISTGADHACGQSGGVGYCWGRNDVGQLGDGSTADREVARAVAGALRFRHIDAVGKHSCAVAVGGALYCWGERQRSGGKPVLVDSNPGYYMVGNSCVYTRNGVASCWGPGLDGNGWEGGAGAGPLGIGLPNLLTGISEPIAFSVRGDAHRCALTTTNALYCWGTWRRGRFDATPTRVTQVHHELTAVSGGVTAPAVSEVRRAYSILRPRLSASQHEVSRAVTVEFLRALAAKELSDAEVEEAMQTAVTKHAYVLPRTAREDVRAAAFLRAYLTLQGTASNDGSADTLWMETIQLYMDSHSKYLRIMSNLMKKVNDTVQALIGNMK